MRKPQDIILKKLYEIENTNEVRILHAIESGSRLWGFDSPDSDYDVRFIYLRKPEYYLSINVEDKRDVIEIDSFTEDGMEFDINGWDLRKALRLLNKSNPSLLEWLTSSIVYRSSLIICSQKLDDSNDLVDYKENINFLDMITPLVAKFYSPTAAYYHYYSMAKNNYKEFLMGNTVLLKKYFYVIRPLLVIKYMDKFPGEIPPTNIFKLIGKLGDSLHPKFVYELKSLLDRKMGAEELTKGPRVPILSDFIKMELNQQNSVYGLPEADKDQNELNEFFRKMVQNETGYESFTGMIN